MSGRKFVIDLNRFNLLHANDTFNHDEPYLWCFGIVIDLRDQDPGSELRFVIKKPATPGNLGNGSMVPGDSRVISDVLGRFERNIDPILGRFFAGGVLVLGWEHDGTQDQTMRVAYDDCARVLDEFIQGRIQQLNQRPLSDAEVEQLKTEFKAVITQRIKQTLNLGSLNHDDNIGADFFFRFFDDPAVPFSNTLGLDLEGSGAHYRVIGSVNYAP